MAHERTFGQFIAKSETGETFTVTEVHKFRVTDERGHLMPYARGERTFHLSDGREARFVRDNLFQIVGEDLFIEKIE